MSTKYFAVLTQLGADKLANATALGIKIEITHMAVGDGGGSLPIPDTKQTKLINEKRRAAINTLSIDSKNNNQIIAEQIIPENEGGWWIREIGLFDKDGILIAVGNCAESYKPQLQEGSGRTQTIRMILIVSSTGAVTLKVDPSVVLATREYVDGAIEAHAKSHNHPDATLKDKGFVILSNAVDSNSETHAATSKAVKEAYENADTRLEKSKNGADIPNKDEFVKNLGLASVHLFPESVIKEPSDLNNFKTSGDYIFANEAVGTNFPEKWGGYLEVRVSAYWLIDQTFTVHSDNTKYFRASLQNGTFTNWVKVYTSGNIAIDSNGYLRINSNIADSIGIPIGASVIWNSNTPLPENFWANEGRAFSASEYPVLAKIFPNLRLPDDRGYAIRCADNGAGIDPGRVVGTYQQDAIRNITGWFGERPIVANLNSVLWGAKEAFVYEERYGSSGVGVAQGVGIPARNWPGLKFDASRVVPVASENRMKNVAKILITRMK
ncbi:phage tail protein [Xenorhabdus bovienii]|uniref:phage tail-collar fiber domain-containing protein n=1 Tax=Xenorhabdus bovienii TaxID=40576 RepID=UPI00237D095E|nr:phage tail protein [Xenorhabdus bovienii]MDE1481015.1 phage tail protein [Xenorhabdus bovienii]